MQSLTVSKRDIKKILNVKSDARLEKILAHPGFPPPKTFPGYSRSRWLTEDVEKWVIRFFRESESA